MAAQFTGQVVVVTGGAGAIGSAVARKFCDLGASAVIADIDGDGAKRVAKALGKKGLAVHADVGRSADVDRLFAETLRAFGRLDVLVNNAGKSHGAHVLDFPEERWDDVMDVNLKSYFLCSQRAGRHWRETKRRGRIVNVGSIDSELPMPEHVAYCVSKAAVVQLTRIFAVALAPMKINVNCVNPGLVEGGMLAGALNKPAERKRLEGYQPWGRFAKPEEIADAVAYLASDAADFVTGSAFTIDGGRMLEFIRT